MRAKPFQAEGPLLSLAVPHPDSASFREAVGDASRRSREILVRLWLTEGAPFAFRTCPAIYEDIRSWLGHRLGVCPKDVTLLGSARIGFSLAPRHYGRPFDGDSDLDFSVVSARLFQDVSATFAQWEADYRNGAVSPRNATERRYWDANLAFGHDNLPLGFFDFSKLPARDRYPIVQLVLQAMWVLIEKLKVTPGVSTPRKASLRVYESWRALVARVSLNLYSALGRRAA